jgi:hypothetical protein
METIYNLLPGWAWISALTILEIILRLIPSSKPYYTILGAIKHILDEIVPDNTNEVEPGKLNKATSAVTKPKRKVWGIFKK